MAPTSLTLLPPLGLALRLSVVVPLAIACLLVAVAIPIAARQGRVTIPACVGIGVAAAGIALLAGRVAGVRRITGTASGMALAVAFFLLSSTAFGSLLALFFYREPPEG
ncbi:MAG TPA: hypothetical protein VL523_12825 [Terriglobia bacterium]|nr:hypothetical protein [Terriglobia bacterium]